MELVEIQLIWEPNGCLLWVLLLFSSIRHVPMMRLEKGFFISISLWCSVVSTAVLIFTHCTFRYSFALSNRVFVCLPQLYCVPPCDHMLLWPVVSPCCPSLIQIQAWSVFPTLFCLPVSPSYPTPSRSLGEACLIWSYWVLVLANSFLLPTFFFISSVVH